MAAALLERSRNRRQGEPLMARRELARMSLDATGAREISLTIPVAPDMEIVATAQAAAVGEFIAMPHDKIDEVKLALVEACINAFEHAHARDDRVHLTFRVDRDEDAREFLEVDVLDQGKGFDPANIADPLDPANLLKPSGRGIFYIRSFMDEVDLRKHPDGGMELRMMKRIVHK